MKFKTALILNDYLEKLLLPSYKVRIHTEVKFKIVDTARGPKKYIADILVLIFSEDKKIVRIFDIEIDLEKGHWSRWNISKNKLRDETLKDKFNVNTIRLNGYWLRNMPDQEIINYIKEDITFSLNLRKFGF